MTHHHRASAAIAFAFASTLTIFGDAIGQVRPPLAQAQQADLAKEILSGDSERRQEAVSIAQALGTSRMSEDVRLALITLLGQLNDVLDEGTKNGAVLENLVHGEFYLELAELVANLHDPRAISALTRVGDHGFSRAAAKGLASFGEDALPAILHAIDKPGASNDAVAYNIMALSAMAADGGALRPSAAAHAEMVRVAKGGLRSQHGTTLLMATELAVALNEPELTQMVRTLSVDTSSLRAQGVAQPTADLVKKHAADTLARASASKPAQ